MCKVIEELKVKDFVEIDVIGKFSVVDYMVIVLGMFSCYVKLIVDEVVKFVK